MNQQQEQLLLFGRGITTVGECLVFLTEKGVCALRYLGKDGLGKVLRETQEEFPHAELREDSSAAEDAFRQVNAWLEGKLSPDALKLDLHGTPFQLRVWKAMLRVPHGETWSYTKLAKQAGNPRAVRAAASACARNPVGLLVPCHRIVRQDGSLGGYGWGLENKKRLLAHERSMH
jgi:AraC family transcriptional regulator of adaptative response/methylated-DNA-[protein]-cysteine methyltransferase